jgi:uncharacterized membrane protein
MESEMKSKTLLACTGIIITLSGCGPGPALGLGPADPIASLILIVVLIVGGFWVVRSAAKSPTMQTLGKQVSMIGKDKREDRSKEAPTAEEILRERYARGEIDRTQFLEMMDDFRKK